MLKKFWLPLWFAIFFIHLLPFRADAQTSTGITFIGRAESSGNSANVTVSVSPPAGIQAGDLMLLCVASYNSAPAAPSGYTRLGTPVVNSNHDYLSAFYKFYAASDGQPYTVGASNWPDAVLRVYRGVSGIDASGYAGTGSAGTSLSLPTLAATSAAGDEYIGCFANDTRAIILPSDLGHATTQASQWQLGDGDKLIANAGTVAPIETATSFSAGNWVGLAATLKAGSAPASTPTPTATPSATATPKPSATSTAAPTPAPTSSPVPTATASPTPAPGSGIAFIGRAEASVNSAGATVTISPPAGFQAGDFMLLCVDSFNSAPAGPSGFTRLGTAVANSNHDYMSSFYKFYATSDAPYVVGASNWPDAVLRVYRGVSGVDGSGYSSTGGPGTSLSLPTLSATSGAGDEYVGCYANDARPVILPSDLGHATAQTSQWFIGDGDKVIANAGTVPPIDTASSIGTANWIGFAATLRAGTAPAPTPVPTATATPTPVTGCTPVYSGTPQGNDASFTTTQNIPAATTAQGCYQIAFVETDDPGTNYTGYPSGWTPVYAVGGPEESEIIIHQNGSSEPASNLWTTAGTFSTVYELNISGVCNTSGYDGGVVAYSATNASSMSIAAPTTSSSGANDLTLAFSNMPWNAIVTMSGASGITGFYTSVLSLGGYWYPGVPKNLAVNVNPTSLVFSGSGVTFQAAFKPAACN